MCADPAHDAVLREDNCISPASLPRFRRAQTRLHQSSAQIVKQFRVDFVVVFRWNRVEGRKSLTESRCEGCYPRGGRSSDGVESGTLSAPGNRSIACRTAPARRIDSLHWRCLTSNLFASGGGADAFIANIATNSSRVISDRRMTLPFRADGSGEGVTQARSRILRSSQRRSRNFGVRGVSRSRTWSMLMCGSGSGIRVPLKTNSRGKLPIFRVVVAILFLQNDCGSMIG